MREREKKGKREGERECIHVQMHAYLAFYGQVQGKRSIVPYSDVSRALSTKKGLLSCFDVKLCKFA